MLNRLTLCVNHDCNLNCRYCYAGGGNYGGSKEYMTKELARACIRKVAEKHSTVHSIQFFGGEPLLNIEVIEEVAIEINNLVDIGKFEKTPSLSVVTNLTTINSVTMNVLKRFNIHVVASIDGPPKIHNYLRITKNNKYTHNIVKKNIELLKKERISFDLVATYTHAHIVKGFSAIDLLNYLYSFSPKKIDIIPVASPSSPELEFDTGEKINKFVSGQIDALRYVIKEIENKRFIPFGLLIEIIQSIQNKNNKLFCPAGISNIAISADGKFYPCHMFINNNKYISDIEKYEQITNFSFPIKSENRSCKNCWAKNWCKACVGKMEIYNSNNPKPLNIQCELAKNTLSYVLNNLTSSIENLKKTIGICSAN